MYTNEFQNFDLEQIAQSGQCFRINQITPCHYSVISQKRYLEICQDKALFTFHCPDEDLEFWFQYFDLTSDYQSYIDSIRPKDFYLQNAAKAGCGIRILNQDVWEMIITFIISQQKTIPKIREAVEGLSRKFGSPISLSHNAKTSSPIFSFPDPLQLSRASMEDLNALKLGYRAKYIYQICQDTVGGALDLDLLKHMDYNSAKAYLTGFYGIGEKVANCVCLFGLHHIDAFPVDTWIQKILLGQYYKKKYDKLPKNRLYETMVHDNFKYYKGYAGVMQQYIFYYERLEEKKLG